MEHSIGETCRAKEPAYGVSRREAGAIVTPSTAPERLLSFGRYDQEAVRARLRRGVPYVHQLRGQPLAQCPVVRIPLWVQTRAFGDLRDHRRLPFLGPAALVANSVVYVRRRRLSKVSGVPTFGTIADFKAARARKGKSGHVA